MSLTAAVNCSVHDDALYVLPLTDHVLERLVCNCVYCIEYTVRYSIVLDYDLTLYYCTEYGTYSIDQMRHV